MKSPILLLVCAGIFSAGQTALADIGDVFGGLFSSSPYSSISTSSLGRNLDTLAARNQHSLTGDLRWATAHPKEYESCQRQFQSFYRDGVLEISLTMGYLDMPSDRVLDQRSFNMVYGALTRACSMENETTCGFWEQERVYRNRVILEKPFHHDFGGIVRAQRIRVVLTYSSATTSDSDNISRAGLTREQEYHSRVAENAFFGSIGEPGHAQIETCDVCGYLGHARDGGGPDFRPVPLAWRKADGKTNYAQYQKNRTNFRRLMRAINSSRHPSRQLIAIMGCNSAGNFAGAPKRCLVDGPNCKPVNLRAFEARTGFLLTSELSWPQNQSKYVAILLDGVINMKCRSAWNSNFAELRTGKKDTEAYGISGNFLR